MADTAENDARARCASSHDGHPCGVCDPVDNDATFTLDEDRDAQAAWLRSLGLDPETATSDDLHRALDQRRVIPPAKGEA